METCHCKAQIVMLEAPKVTVRELSTESISSRTLGADLRTSAGLGFTCYLVLTKVSLIVFASTIGSRSVFRRT